MSVNFLTSKTETQQSNIANLGTFAREKICQGDLIAIFGGYVMDGTVIRKLPESVRYLVLQISEDRFIGAQTSNDCGDGDYINHCCQPNAGINGQIFLVAMRDIEIGEEITFDYAMTVSDELFAEMKCCCGALGCRGVVTCHDWKNEDLQKKYAGYFSYYLQQKIADLIPV